MANKENKDSTPKIRFCQKFPTLNCPEYCPLGRFVNNPYNFRNDPNQETPECIIKAQKS